MGPTDGHEGAASMEEKFIIRKIAVQAGHHYREKKKENHMDHGSEQKSEAVSVSKSDSKATFCSSMRSRNEEDQRRVH